METVHTAIRKKPAQICKYQIRDTFVRFMRPDQKDLLCMRPLCHVTLSELLQT